MLQVPQKAKLTTTYNPPTTYVIPVLSLESDLHARLIGLTGQNSQDTTPSCCSSTLSHATLSHMHRQSQSCTPPPAANHTHRTGVRTAPSLSTHMNLKATFDHCNSCCCWLMLNCQCLNHRQQAQMPPRQTHVDIQLSNL